MLHGAIYLALLGSLAAPDVAAAASDDALPSPVHHTVRVFLLAGQSNMEGRADGHRLTPEEVALVHAASARVQLAFNGDAPKPLGVVQPDPSIAAIYGYDRIFGPELFFGVAMAEAWPNEHFLLIKYTAGATSLYGSWNPDWSAERAAEMDEADNPPLYQAFVDYAREVLAGLDSHDYELCAMLWVQGESDSGAGAAEAAYGENLERLIESVRRDFGKPGLPFLLFQVGKGGVVDGMKRTATTMDRVVLIPRSADPGSPDYYTTIPNGHIDHGGMRKLGFRFAETYLARFGDGTVSP